MVSACIFVVDVQMVVIVGCYDRISGGGGGGSVGSHGGSSNLMTTRSVMDNDCT